MSKALILSKILSVLILSEKSPGKEMKYDCGEGGSGQCVDFGFKKLPIHYHDLMMNSFKSFKKLFL